MNERNRDRRRIDNTRDKLLRQRLVVLTTLTKLQGALDLLRELIDAAPRDGMASFESDVLICKDHLRETSREIWTQIKEMIDTINGDAVNKIVVPTASPQANLVKIKCQLGSSGVWLEATPERLSLFDSDETFRVSIPVSNDSELERVVMSLIRVARFLENKGTAKPS